MAKPEEIRMAGHAEHNGHPCLVLEKVYRAPPGGSALERYWLAEDQDYSLVQWQVENEGKVLCQAVIQYVKHEGLGWLPKSWDVALVQPGNVVRSSVNVVTCLTVNEPIEAETCEISFPDGTLVSDRIRDPEYRVGGVSPFLIEGKARNLLAGELVQPLSSREATSATSDQSMGEFVEKVGKQTRESQSRSAVAAAS